MVTSKKKMNNKEKEIKRKLISKRNIIKSKLNLLKQGQIVHENVFSPITKHLKTIETKLTDNDKKRKGNQNDYESEFIENEDISDIPPLSEKPADGEPPSFKSSTPKQVFHKRLQQLKQNEKGSLSPFSSSPSSFKKSILKAIEEEEEEEQKKNVSAAAVEGSFKHSSILSDVNDEQSFLNYLEQYESLPRKYIHEMYTGDPNLFDHKTGVRHDPETEKFYIGNSQLYIDGSDVVVKNKKYKGTPGLYELLFKKNPVDYTETDLKNYKDILQKTYAHKRYYQPNKQIAGSRSKKYQKIIAPLVVGKGLFMEVNNNTVDYTYWNDPNELVDRLRLLIASQEAGHTGHTNEINSIIEELQEANIIE